MPSEIVQADYDVLESVTNTFNQLADVNQDMYNSVRSMSEQLSQEGWIGRGSNAFFAEMSQDVLPRLQRLCQALEEAGQTTRQISQIMEQAEQEARSRFAQGSGAGNG